MDDPVTSLICEYDFLGEAGKTSLDRPSNLQCILQTKDEVIWLRRSLRHYVTAEEGKKPSSLVSQHSLPSCFLSPFFFNMMIKSATWLLLFLHGSNPKPTPETNAQRFTRGAKPVQPRRLYDATRVSTAAKSKRSVITSGPLYPIDCTSLGADFAPTCCSDKICAVELGVGGVIDCRFLSVLIFGICCPVDAPSEFPTDEDGLQGCQPNPPSS